MESISRYETRCPSCKVTFPVETKVCIHCGGRTGPSMVRLPDPSPDREGAKDTESIVDILRRRQQSADPSRIEAEVSVEDEEEQVRPSRMRSLMTLIWVVLAIGISVVRACSEGPP